MIELRLPLAPSVNGLYANIPGKGRVKSERYRTWINAAGWSIKEQRQEPVLGNYVLYMWCGRPDARKRDLANMVKATEDLLVAHKLVQDDSLCSETHLFWYPALGRECIVRVEPAPQ